MYQQLTGMQAMGQDQSWPKESSEMGTACLSAPQHKPFCSMDLPLLGWWKETCCEPFTGSSFPGSVGLGMSYKGASTLASSRGKRPEHSLGCLFSP